MQTWSERQRCDGMRNAFARAAGSCPEATHETWYSFAGHAARVRVVGDRLSTQMALPFAHLRRGRCDPAHAKLTIDLWDQLETGIAPDIDVAPDPLGLSSSFSTSKDDRFVTSVLQYSMSNFDRREEQIVGVAFGTDRLSLYERGRPLHVPLSLWYNDRGIPLVHAALVSHGEDGILLAGATGTGKTTSSLSCTAAGFQYLADDLTGLEALTDGTFWGHSVHGSAFVDEETLRRLPALRKHAIPGAYSHEDKNLVFVAQAIPGRLMAKTRLRAIALVQVTNADRTRARAATKGDSLLAMARSSLQSGPLSPGRRGFELLGSLSDNVPSFWLEIGADPVDIPRRVLGLLSEDQDPNEWRAR
jgi:hypothetical protein